MGADTAARGPQSATGGQPNNTAQSAGENSNRDYTSGGTIQTLDAFMRQDSAEGRTNVSSSTAAHPHTSVGQNPSFAQSNLGRQTHDTSFQSLSNFNALEAASGRYASNPSMGPGSGGKPEHVNDAILVENNANTVGSAILAENNLSIGGGVGTRAHNAGTFPGPGGGGINVGAGVTAANSTGTAQQRSKPIVMLWNIRVVFLVRSCPALPLRRIFFLARNSSNQTQIAHIGAPNVAIYYSMPWNNFSRPWGWSEASLSRTQISACTNPMMREK